MNNKKLPNWLQTAIIIFPILIVSGLLASILTMGKFNFLFWLIIPSIIFEQLVESFSQTLSDSYVANFLFAILFWFIIGGTFGLVSEKIKKIN